MMYSKSNFRERTIFILLNFKVYIIKFYYEIFSNVFKIRNCCLFLFIFFKYHALIGALYLFCLNKVILQIRKYNSIFLAQIIYFNFFIGQKNKEREWKKNKIK